jgi:peptidoglycan/xylan/chitin deacetylase (PgdA/CDA1 family)
VRQAASRIVKRALLESGHYRRRLRRDSFPGVAVLCYHGIRADGWPAGTMTFEGLHVRSRELAAHCRLIRETCHPISLGQWHRARAGGTALPSRPVLFTFDDGYRTAFTMARPILERYAIPAVMLICSDPVAQRRLFWYDAMARARGEAEVQRAKTLPFDEWKALDNTWSRAVEDKDPNAPMTPTEIRALAATPGIEIGGHTAAHPILARGNLEQQRCEITRNKKCLEDWIGRPVTAFAYPNGRPAHDYTAETIALVKASGYETAFTTWSGFATAREDPLECPRFLMLAGISAAELAHRLCYSWRRPQRA